jgi:hypothetical protein
MRSRKVFRIYASLTEEERGAFGRYLASPYFNRSQRLVDFRVLLEQELVLLPERQLDTQDIWSLLPGITTDYRANGFDKLCAELLAALNDFLGTQAFRAHPATVAQHQLRAYVDHGFDEWIPAMYEGLVERLGKELERDPAGLYAHMQLLYAFAQHQFRVARMPKIEGLLEIDRKLNEFYFAGKLELAAAVTGYNRYFRSDVTLPHLDQLQTMFEVEIDGYPVLIRCQFHAWLMTRDQDVNHYFALKGLLQDYGDQLPSDEVKALYRHALNFCIARLNAEEEDFEEELDALQLQLLENGMILDEGRLNPLHLKNIVLTRLNMGQVEWVADFLQKWGNRLTNDHSGCALRYNEAMLAFHQGDFSRCLREMETVLRDHKGDIYYGIDARVYSLMSVFELNKHTDWVQEFEARLNSFRLYLIRDQKLGETRRQKRLDMVKQFRKLLRLFQEPESKRREKAKALLKSIESLKPSTNRNWFERQISSFL